MSEPRATVMPGRRANHAVKLASIALLLASAAGPTPVHAAATGARPPADVTAADSAMVRTMLARLIAVTPKPNVKYAWPPRWFI